MTTSSVVACQHSFFQKKTKMTTGKHVVFCHYMCKPPNLRRTMNLHNCKTNQKKNNDKHCGYSSSLLAPTLELQEDDNLRLLSSFTTTKQKKRWRWTSWLFIVVSCTCLESWRRWRACVHRLHSWLQKKMKKDDNKQCDYSLSFFRSCITTRERCRAM